MNPLYPAVPDDLTALSDDDLRDLAGQLAERVELVSRRDETIEFGDRTQDDVLAETTAAVESYEAIEAELAARETAQQTHDTAMADLAARVRPAAEAEEPPPVEDPDAGSDEDEDTADDDDADAGPGDPAEARQPALVAAGRPSPRMVRRHAPAPTVPDSTREWSELVASADAPGVAAGAQMSRRQLAETIIRRRDSMGSVPEGFSEKISVATLRHHYPADRTVRKGDEEGNWDRLQRVVQEHVDLGVEENAIVASGGLCAPRTPYYDLLNFSETMRPVRDALPRIGAERGGITFAPPPALSSVTTGVGLKTAAQDQTGGTTAAKTCQVVACPSTVSVDVDAIFHCLQFGNMGSRAWPERVEQFTDLTMAAHARLAETNLLDSINAASLQVAGTQNLGAVASILSEVITAAAAMRNRHRMDPRRPLRFLGPAWLLDMLVVDLIRGQFDRFSRDQAGVEALLRSIGVIPTFYVDGPTGAAQLFGTQSSTGAALNTFPSTAKWFLYPEGSFVFLDFGSLELGVVRDSTLNNTNDYQLFGEVWEEAAFVGVESLAVTSTVCPTGTTAGTASASCAIA